MESFYHTVMSDASMNFYPDNTISNFKNHLHSPLKLDDYMYEVAITKYSYVYSKRFLEVGTLLYSFIQASNVYKIVMIWVL